ncbi:phosphatidate cytidylyltransferase [Photobacterium aphoticum]|uniref:Phosphatidate cytidylyltransferase n=1 Tax=Photobacterium aphoticum TaxID=754436 RepID=A0A090R0K4_9GAMM|nr:phosphatidate cytidylyltransferase [Photobacterium aphoticum]
MQEFFFLPFPAFIAALAAITLIGFWEWTQFVEAKSRVAAMIVPVVSLAASLWFMPTDPQALSTLATSHHIMLMTGGVWWLIASALAITYTQRHMVVRDLSSKYLFGLLTLIPFFWSVLMLRAVHYLDSPYHGAKLVLLVCLLVWAADTGAYFSGKRLVNTKWPQR